MPNQMYTTRGNQGYSLRNMARTHRDFFSKYLSELEITFKGHLGNQKQVPAAETPANVTPLLTKAGENKSEVLLQIFHPTEKFIMT